MLACHPEWRLDLAGEGAERGLVLERAAGLPNVIYHGVLPYAEALAMSYAADVLPAFYDPSIPNHRYASPNKLYEGMMLGRPVLAARHTGFDRLVAELDCGLVMEYGNKSQIEAALRSLEEPALRLRLGENGRRAYDQIYAWPRMAQRLVDLYAGLEAA